MRPVPGHLRPALLAAAAFLALFGVVLAGAGLDFLDPLDRAAEAAAVAVRFPALTSFMRVATDVGEFEPMLFATLVVVLAFVLARRIAYGVLFAVLMPAGNLLVDTLKDVFHRARPLGEPLVPLPDSFAFPSGHSSASALFFGLLALVALRELRAPAARAAALAACVLAVLSISLSRVYLGVHRFTDVVASWALAGMWLSLALAALAWRERRAHAVETDAG